MPVPLLAVLGAAAVVVALVVGLVLFERRRLAARDADFGREAAQRGWRYTSGRFREGRTERWQGLGLGGPWTLEVVERSRRKRQAVRITRWWNAGPDAAPATGPLVLLVARGDEMVGPIDAATSGGMLAELLAGAAQMGLAFAVDYRFGPVGALSGRTLERVDEAQPIVEGFAVLSDDPAGARRRLTPDLVAALRLALPPAAWTDGAIRQPWVSLAGDRLVIAGTSRLAPRIADIAALVQAGGQVAQRLG